MTSSFSAADIDGIRQRTLAAWAASPIRFREDANAEEDFALGGYRDRLIVELAQNAADAAARSGDSGRGRLRFTLQETTDGPVLVAANTGSPLTAEGVESLASLRASAKRATGESVVDTVGRFGVGFAAVLSVSDEPMVLSRTGGVRFSREDTAELVGELAGSIPGLAEELRRRAGHLPVLRLPFDANGEPPQGFDTAVILQLRDEAAADLVRRLMAEVDDALLLALPALDRIELDIDGDERVLSGVAERWEVHRAEGRWTDTERVTLLSDRPTEERFRSSWSVVWAIPRDPLAEVPQVLHAPTPTDEPISLPGLLLASFPLETSRRHVAPGPLTERLVVEAGRAYAAFAASRAANGADVLSMVPVGLASGALDATLRAAILAELPSHALLRAVEDHTLIRPRDALAIEGLDDDPQQVLAPIVAGLVAAPRSALAALNALGVRRISLADLVDELTGAATARPPEWWRSLYDSFGQTVIDPQAREELGAIPVPLADGRVVRGARGVLLPYEKIPPNALTILAPYGLRIVHPDAASPILERFGALPAKASLILADPAVRAAVEDSADSHEAAEIADAVLSLVEPAIGQPEGSVAGKANLTGQPHLSWLGELALVDADGERAPAGTLVIPGSPAERLLDPEEFAPIDGSLVERWGDTILEAVGVVKTLSVNVIDPAARKLPDLPGAGEWFELFGDVLEDTALAVRDLDFIEPNAWPEALALLGSEPDLREALLGVPSYTAWWIRRHLGLDGCADPDADEVVRALLPAPADFVGRADEPVRGALGLVRELENISDLSLEILLARLVNPEVWITPAQLLETWRRIGTISVPEDLPEPASLVRIVDGSRTSLVDAKDVVVVDEPMWLQRTDLGSHVVGTAESAEVLAELFDLALAPESAAGKVDDEGTETPVSDGVLALVPGISPTWQEHDELTVDGFAVDWWVDGDGRAHAATTDGLARALAWSADAWSARYLIATLLAEPERSVDLLTEATYDEG